MLKFTAITRCNKTHPNSNTRSSFYKEIVVLCETFIMESIQLRGMQIFSVGNIPAGSFKSVEVLSIILIYAETETACPGAIWMPGLKSSGMALCLRTCEFSGRFSSLGLLWKSLWPAPVSIRWVSGRVCLLLVSS